MIYLNKNSTNQVALTLSELITITSQTPYYLFRFVSDDTKNELLFTAPDVSTNPTRYNLFNIIETGVTFQNLTAGTINLNNYNGFYKYEIYQMSGQTNLSLTGVTGLPIEYGKVLITGNTSQNIQSYKYTGSTFRQVYVYSGS